MKRDPLPTLRECTEEDLVTEVATDKATYKEEEWVHIDLRLRNVRDDCRKEWQYGYDIRVSRDDRLLDNLSCGPRPGMIHEYRFRGGGTWTLSWDWDQMRRTIDDPRDQCNREDTWVGQGDINLEGYVSVGGGSRTYRIEMLDNKVISLIR